MKVLGFLVMEFCEDFSQVLVLRAKPGFPPGGLLDWDSGNKDARALFPTRQAARAAIDRTEHYRLAFAEPSKWPEKRFCTVVPVREVAT